MIKVETKGVLVALTVADCRIELEPSEATDLAATIRSHAVEARSIAYREWRVAAESACLAEGHRLAGQSPAVRVIGGTAWRVVAGAVSVLVPARVQPDLAPSWSVASELPPEWPILWVRVAGGRVRHAWRGGRQAVCGVPVSAPLAFDGDSRACPKCEAKA